MYVYFEEKKIVADQKNKLISVKLTMCMLKLFSVILGEFQLYCKRGFVSIAQLLERLPPNPGSWVRALVGTDIYVPAMLRSSYLLANKGYA